jgi:Outer membrane protein beta-barrel domain
MKAQIFITTVAILLSTSIFAQSNKLQKFAIGLKGGANINKLTGKTFKEQFSYGYQGGGFITIPLGEKIAVQPEVMFNQINADTSSDFSKIYNFNKISAIKLQYLSIPVLLNYSLNKIVVLQAGPQFGILVNKKNSLIQNGKEAFKAGDLSMLGGVQLSVLNFRIYGRYAIGLNNINDIDKKDKWKNQSVQLGLGVTL